MSTFLVYESDDGTPTYIDDLAAVLIERGAAFDRAGGYRPGRWHDAATGSSLTIDLGETRLEIDELHPAKTYAGWRAVPLVVQVPLSVAHWQAVEALAWIEGFLAQMPDLAVLDTEDTRVDEDAEDGPFPFQRLRALASWERQHRDQTGGRADLPRLARAASLALWRYRRERATGLISDADCVWPEALVLCEGLQAVSVAFWSDPTRPLAAPPVDYLIIPRPDHPGLIPLDEVLTVAKGGRALPQGLARRIDPVPALADLHQRARLVPASRFASVADGEWSD